MKYLKSFIRFIIELNVLAMLAAIAVLAYIIHWITTD